MYMIWQQSALKLADPSVADQLVVFGLLRLDGRIQFLVGGWSHHRSKFCIKVTDTLSITKEKDVLKVCLLTARMGLCMSDRSSNLRVSENPPLPLARALPKMLGSAGVISTAPRASAKVDASTSRLPPKSRSHDTGDAGAGGAAKGAHGADTTGGRAAGTASADQSSTRGESHGGGKQMRGNGDQGSPCVISDLADVSVADVVYEATGIDVGATARFEQVVSRRSRSVWVGTNTWDALVVKLIRDVESGRREANNRARFASICPNGAAMLMLNVEHKGTSWPGFFAANAVSHSFARFVGQHKSLSRDAANSTYPLHYGASFARDAALVITKV